MDRRLFLAGTAAVVLVPLSPATATPDAMAEAIRKVVGTATPTEGRVKLDVPPLVENGSTVPLTVSVDSPMTEADHVKAIHVFNEKNPQPNVFSARLGPRIKLGDSQRIVAIVETSDGKFLSAGADVIVTLAACLEESP